MIDLKKYDVRMFDMKGRFWGEIDFLEDYRKVDNNISENLLELFQLYTSWCRSMHIKL